MALILDLVSSTIIGGMMMMIMISANDIAAETTSTYSGDVLVQEMLITQAQMIEGEFRNMGFGVKPGKPTVLAANDTAISFLTDLDRNGVLDTVRYQLGNVSELSSTANELDRFIHRRVNGGADLRVATVTTFFLRYISTSGIVLASPVPTDQLPEIHEVELTMEVQNPFALARPVGQVKAGERDAFYSSSFWQQTRLASQNLRR